MLPFDTKPDEILRSISRKGWWEFLPIRCNFHASRS